MSSTGSTTTASSPATSVSSFFSTLESDIVTGLQDAENFIMTFLTNVANGAEILLEDIEAVASYVNTNAGIISSTVTAVTTAANAIAPNNAEVQKVASDLQTATSDVQSLATALTTGNTSGDPAIVTTAVAAVNAVKTTQQLAAQTAAALAQLTSSSPTATQAVSQPTPAQA